MGTRIATTVAVAQNTKEKISLKARLCEPISLFHSLSHTYWCHKVMQPEAQACYQCLTDAVGINTHSSGNARTGAFGAQVTSLDSPWTPVQLCGHVGVGSWSSASEPLSKSRKPTQPKKKLGGGGAGGSAGKAPRDKLQHMQFGWAKLFKSARLSYKRWRIFKDI